MNKFFIDLSYLDLSARMQLKLRLIVELMLNSKVNQFQCWAMTGIDYILGTQFSNDSLEGCIHTAKIWQSDIIRHEQASKVESISIRYLQDGVDFTGKVEIK